MITSHIGHRGDITLADQRCPTRKDASPSCTNKDGSVYILPITETAWSMCGK